MPTLSEMSYIFRAPDAAIVTYGADTPWGRLEVEVTLTDKGVHGNRDE